MHWMKKKNKLIHSDFSMTVKVGHQIVLWISFWIKHMHSYTAIKAGPLSTQDALVQANYLSVAPGYIVMLNEV